MQHFGYLPVPRGQIHFRLHHQICMRLHTTELVHTKIQKLHEIPYFSVYIFFVLIEVTE